MKVTVFWLGVLSTATGFLLAQPRTMPMAGCLPDPSWAALFTTGLLLTLVTSERPAPSVSLSPTFAIAGLVAGVALILMLPMPFKLMGWCPMLAAFLALMPTKGAARISNHFVALSMHVVLWACVVLCLQRLFATYQTATWLTPFLSKVWGALGVEAAASAGQIVLADGGESAIVVAGLPDLFPAIAVLWIASILLHCLQKTAVIKIAGLAVATLAFLILRFLIIVDYGLLHGDSAVRITETSALLTLIPLSLLPSFFCLAPVAWSMQRAMPARPAIATLVGTALLLVGMNLQLTGPPAAGRVLVQEYNSRWEPTDVAVNTSVYGVRTVYNYTAFTAELGRFFEVTRGMQALTDDVLSHVDVLILKCPTRAYSPSEVSAVNRYVEKGGGLWLIGDHTNVFGMDTYLNQIASGYGCAFQADAVFDPVYSRQLYGSSADFSHPTVASLSEPYLFYTSCSIRAPLFVEGALIGNRLAIDAPDPSVNTFFGDFTLESSEYAGPVIQATAFRSGKGRVAMWADSTVYSTFSVFMPGQMEQGIATVSWLNQRGGGDWVKVVLVSLGVLFLCWSLLSTGVFRNSHVACCIIVGTSLGLGGAWTYNRQTRTRPLASSNARMVSFVVPARSYALPLVYTSGFADDYSYLTAFVSAIRAGGRPIVRSTLSEALHDEVICLPKGGSPLAPGDAESLWSYVNDGGKVVLLDSFYQNSELAHLLSLAGLRVEHRKPVDSQVRTVERRAIVGREIVTRHISGGEPILEGGGSTVLASKTIGKGKILLSVTNSLFSDKSLGENSAIPNAAQYDLLKILFRAYEQE